MSILFDGFAELAEMVDKSGADLKEAVNEALVESQKIVQHNLTTGAAVYAAKGLKGYATGDMYSTIIGDGAISWEGSVATVNAGFRLDQGGGWHSIFVMYGTPRMSKDTKVYNAIKGTKTRKAIAKKQEEIMVKHLKLGGA
jgi:hypothetical protein